MQMTLLRLHSMLFRLLREVRGEIAVQLAGDDEPTREAVESADIDMKSVGSILQAALGGVVLQELAELERSDVPELQRASKRRRIRLRLEPYRPRRKRLVLDALYDEHGTPIEDDSAIGDAIAAESAPVFAEKARDIEAVTSSLVSCMVRIGHGLVVGSRRSLVESPSPHLGRTGSLIVSGRWPLLVFFCTSRLSRRACLRDIRPRRRSATR